LPLEAEGAALEHHVAQEDDAKDGAGQTPIKSAEDKKTVRWHGNGGWARLGGQDGLLLLGFGGVHGWMDCALGEKYAYPNGRRLLIVPWLL
jgi:hypothetical protein